MRSHEFTAVPDLLDEVKMSPGALQKWANGPETQGMLMGIEFEMVVPDAVGGDDQYQEVDESMNVEVDSIDHFTRWLANSDYYMSSDANRIGGEISEKYYEWLADGFDYWLDEQDDFLPGVYDRMRYKYDMDAALERAREELGDDADEDAIEERAKEIADEDIQQSMDDQDRDWERAYDEVWEEYQQDYESERSEADWLNYMRISDMMDMCNQFGIPYPYYTNGGSGRDVDEIATEFSQAMGMPVNVGRDYHGGERAEGTWVLEPDGSIEDMNDPSTEAGLEFISPPQSIDKTLSDLNKIWNWANDNGCYTTNDTGLHMNVSVPDYSRETLDFVKLALFTGDIYILQQFDREFNTFCQSAIKKIKANITPENTAQVIEQMRVGLNSQAAKIVHNGATAKYTSINTKDGWVEFRSPGGDYLSRSPEELSMTALRFARALSIACDPNAYKEEYAKKLYKLLTANGVDQTSIRYFADYSAGKIDKAQLKAFINQKQARRKETDDLYKELSQPADDRFNPPFTRHLDDPSKEAFEITNSTDGSRTIVYGTDEYDIQAWCDRNLSYPVTVRAA